MLGQPVEIRPRIKTRVVAIREVRLNRILANRRKTLNRDIALAHLQDLLPWSMAHNLCGGGIDPEKLKGKPKAAAIFVGEFQYCRLLVNNNRPGYRRGVVMTKCNKTRVCH